MSWSNLKSVIVTILLGLMMTWWMRGWINSGIPLTPREENIPQLSDIWSLKHAAGQNYLWTGWNPSSNCGSPNLIQRSYVLFAPLAQIAASFNISVDTIYKITVALAFIFSGVGMFLALKVLRLKPLACLIGATIYMLIPPHITLGSDLLDFNFYWTSIPWILFVVERFISLNNLSLHAGWLGVFLSWALFNGNTYFVSTMPLIFLYICLRLIFSCQKLKTKIQFLLLSGMGFISISAFITLPSLIETPFTWLSQEVTRKQIIDLPSITQLIKLFLLRWQGHSPLEWEMNSRYPDMSWYLGSVTVILSLIGLTQIKTKWKIILPCLILVLIFIPFLLIMQIDPLKQFILNILSLMPSLQSIFDRTYRLFLLPCITLTILAAVGAEFIINQFSKVLIQFIAVIILLLVTIDYFPLSAYFYSIPQKDLQIDASISQIINSNLDFARYWSPFTFVRHLPKYRYEYINRYLTKPRVNSEYAYAALSPRYSSEIYEKTLFGALETNSQPIEKVVRILNWGSTKYILFHQPIFNYEEIITRLSKNGWQEVSRDNQFILLENTAPLPLIQIYTNFKPIPSQFKNDFESWYQLSDQNLALYYGSKISELNQSPNQPQPQILSWQRPQPNLITAKVNINQPALIVASESWYPGWQVYVDNKLFPLVRANYAFLGVIVPLGNHQIKFIYQQPWYYMAGKIISLIALLIVAVNTTGYVLTKRKITDPSEATIS